MIGLALDELYDECVEALGRWSVGVEARSRAPMPEQPRLDELQAQRLAQRVIEQVDVTPERKFADRQ